MMRIVVVFESTRGRTKAMADAICEGVKSAGVDCDLINAPGFKELGDACALAIGASTRMKRPLPKVRQILSELQSLDGKSVAAFGSYG
ncbi:MAG: flavodoxin domain-containing protein, partial [Candidatus Thorarchaeota archaeon]